MHAILNTAKDPLGREPPLRRRMLLAVSLALGTLLSAPGAMAIEPVDLGQGLAYLRIRSLGDSEDTLRKAVPAAGALVLDLRFTTANEASLPALQDALASRQPQAPLFVLLSPSTPASVIEALDHAPRAFISLGVPSSHPARITVRSDAEADRRAYDALEAGTPLDALISGKVEKERFDESTLVREFKNGGPAAVTARAGPAGPNLDPSEETGIPKATPVPRTGEQAPADQAAAPVLHAAAERQVIEKPAGAEPDKVSPGSAPRSATSPPERVTDRVLQRAVHLHRALRALESSG